MINTADVGELIKLVLETDSGKQEGKCPDEQIQGFAALLSLFVNGFSLLLKKIEILKDFFLTED